MRILVLNYEHPPLGGGGGTVCQGISQGYVQQGHEVDVVTMGFGELPPLEVQQGVRIHRVRCLRRSAVICHPWEQLTYLSSARAYLTQRMSDQHFDAIHGHFIVPTGILTLQMSRKLQIPYILTAHGSDVLDYNPRFRWFYPLVKGTWMRVVQEASGVVSPSQFLAKCISRYSPEARMEVIPNGLAHRDFSVMQKEAYFLVVARLFPNKGLQDLLHALEGVQMGSWKVRIVGDGPYRTYLQQLTRRLGLQKQIEFLGWVAPGSKQLKELYGRASVFVLPSHFENMSMAILEAKASGCHVIAARVGGNPECVESENLFEAKDIPDLKRQILRFAGKPVPPAPSPDYWKMSDSVRRYLKLLERIAQPTARSNHG